MPVKTLPANAVISHDPEQLKDIHLSTKNIAVLERDLASLNLEIAEIEGQPIECRAKGSKEEITATLLSYFNNELPGHQALLEDVLGLLEHFSKITEATSFRLLLATVTTNMCRRFHTDINDLRMLCTYLGPGTLWVPDEAINRKAYRQGKGNEDIIADSSLIQQASTGDVVILKGALYPDANPILHRSPTIEEKGEKRLLLRIDTNATQNLWG